VVKYPWTTLPALKQMPPECDEVLDTPDDKNENENAKADRLTELEYQKEEVVQYLAEVMVHNSL
jgi:hypothetical protein